jgi:type IV pilus assembly protein PilP
MKARPMQRHSIMTVWSVVLLLIAGLSVAYAAESGAENEEPTAYSFNPVGKPDPFKPFVDKDLVLKKKAETVAAVSIFPLQKVPLDQFTLIGIAGDAERKLAVVETKDSKGSRFYILIVGTVIGLNSGKVVAIKNDHIVVEEVTTLRSGKKINKIIKKLRKDEEGTP